MKETALQADVSGKSPQERKMNGTLHARGGKRKAIAKRGGKREQSEDRARDWGPVRWAKRANKRLGGSCPA